MVEQKKHIVISGRVQGVGFRVFVLRKAKELGIKGWVRNTYEGDVEIVIVGEKAALDKMIKELKKGPRWASVDKVNIDNSDIQEDFTDFRIRG